MVIIINTIMMKMMIIAIICFVINGTVITLCIIHHYNFFLSFSFIITLYYCHTNN